MGYLAQEPSVFRSLSVKDNVLAILQTLPLKPQEMEKRCKELLSELRLENIADKKAASLSGGERRRLEITRSLVTNPAILLLDEPFANIDPISVSDVKNLIKALSFRGIAILITDHNAREIFSVVDRSYIMKDGKLIAEGDSSTLLKSQVAKESYLGEGFKIY